jgi:hypothetical protein
MIPKISLTAAFFLLVAPPLACASNHGLTHTRQTRQAPARMVVAQDTQPSVGTDAGTDSDSNSDSSDSSDDNQNAQGSDGNQGDQQNAAGNDQALPPTELNGSDNDPNDTPGGGVTPYSQPVNPYQQ